MFKNCPVSCQIATGILNRFQFDLKVLTAQDKPEQLILLVGEEKAIQPPEIQINKINPTKYIFSIKKARRPFFLRLDENFDRGWKAYIIPYRENTELQNNTVKSFEAPLSTLGPRELDISHWQKDCSDEECIGNKKLELSASLKGLSFPGKIRKALNLEPTLMWPEKFHWEVDGYANSWYIDLRLLEMMNEDFGGLYQTDDQGTRSMNIVVEFSPQKLHFIGLIGSLITLGILGFYFIILFFQKLRVTSAK